MEGWLNEAVTEHQEIFRNSLGLFRNELPRVIEACAGCLHRGGTLFWAGNGGSAADSQHMAAELVGRYLRERRALRSVALSVNTSNLTAIANDYGYERVFARQLEALGRRGDAIVAISTSGNSPNIIEVAKTARDMGIFVVGLTGQGGGRLKECADLLIAVPSTNTPRIQEVHLAIEHIICDGLERACGAADAPK